MTHYSVNSSSNPFHRLSRRKKISVPLQVRPSTVHFKHTRYRRIVARSEQSSLARFEFDTAISSGRSTSEIRGTSRCIGFYGAFYSGVPDHRSSLLSLSLTFSPLSFSSYSPVDPTDRAVSFAVKEEQRCRVMAGHRLPYSRLSTPTLHLLYSPPFARCTLVKPRFIMRRI